MGRGDRKTRKGKTAIRSYGNVRPSKKATAGTGKAVVKKTPATKTPAAPAKRPAAGAARPAAAGAAKTAAPKKKA
jgi:30S ribosomal protein S31